MPLSIIAGRPRRELRRHFGGAAPRRRELVRGVGPLFRLRAQRPLPLVHRAALGEHPVARDLRFLQRRRRRLQLLQPVLEEVAVDRDVLELPVELRQHRFVLVAQRALARRAHAVGAERRHLVALLLDLFP